MPYKLTHYPEPEELLCEVRVKLTEDAVNNLPRVFSLEHYVSILLWEAVLDLDICYVERQTIPTLADASPKVENQPRYTGYIQVFYKKGPAAHELAEMLRQYTEFEDVEAVGAPLPATSKIY